MNNNIAFIFSGQGSQYIGMGKDLYEKYDIVKNTYNEASEVLGFDVADMSFTSDEINKTEYTQPLILTMSIAVMRLLKEFKINPFISAGLSLGEYSSLVTAGVLDFKTAVSLVHKRGKYMQEAIPDGSWKMAAIIGMEDGKIEEICSKNEGFVRCVNYNCPGQVVIAGEENAVLSACEDLKDAGAKRTILLNVSSPFHTEKLVTAKEKMEKELNQIKFGNFEIPVIKNLDAKEYTDKEDIVKILSNHVVSPVKWRKSVEKMIELGANCFIEIGPGKTLSGFVKKINKEVKVLNVENIESLEKCLNEINKI